MRDMAGFTKLFGSILDSTIWEEDLPTKVVWITMLAMCDRDGVVEASVPGLAKRAGVTREQCERALASFSSPDEDSRTKTNDGRRIREVDGGWVMLNYEKYRMKASADEVRMKAAERQRRRRTLSREVSRPVTQSHRSHDIAEAEAEADLRVGRQAAPTPTDHDLGSSEPLSGASGSSGDRGSSVARPKRAKVARSAGQEASPEAAALWAYQDELRAQVIPGARPLSPTPQRLARVTAALSGATVEDCRAVLESIAARCKVDPGQAQWFDGVTNWRSENFDRQLGKVGAPAAGGAYKNDSDRALDRQLERIRMLEMQEAQDKGREIS